jgi:hypothetical protein
MTLSAAVYLLLLATTNAETQPVEALVRQRAEAFVAALGSAEPGALEAFARENLESRVAREGLAGRFAERMRAGQAELGPVERHAVQVLRGGTLVFVYCKHARSEAWQNYQFRVLAQDEHRLQLVFRAVALEPMERPSAPLDSEEARQWLRRFEASLESQQPFSGMAVVRARGQEVYSRVKGVSDAARERPMTRQSRLGMASGSKMFTAVAILQLAQAGKLSVSDPLAKHLPGFPDAAFAKRATLHQLLTHTAGAGNYWDDAYEKAWERSRSCGRCCRSSWPISVSPRPEHVFAPAAMRSTGFPVRGDAVRKPFGPGAGGG